MSGTLIIKEKKKNELPKEIILSVTQGSYRTIGSVTGIEIKTSQNLEETIKDEANNMIKDFLIMINKYKKVERSDTK